MSRKTKNQQETGLGGDFVPSRLRPIDIQQQEFSTSFRGYEPTEVDAFLDRLTEDYATLHEENKRLKEGGPLIPASGAVAADAEAILRQAHAQADAILNEARTRAAAVAAGGSSGGEDPLASVWPFLAKEREFLRSLAASVQEHAEGVKRQAKQLQGPAKQTPPIAAPKPVAPAAAAPAAAAPKPVISPAPAQRPAAPEVAPPTLPAPERSPRTSSSTPLVPGESAWTQTARDATPPVVKIPPSSVDTPPARPVPSTPSSGENEASDEEPTLRELFWNDES